MFEFETMKLGWRPNQFLMAPSGLCRVSKPHTLSPTFQVPVAELKQAFMAVVARQPRTEVVEEGANYAKLVQRSKLMRFPDDIDVRFVSLGNTDSTFAIYSRARYGIRDFGVNQARVRHWLGQLHEELNGTVPT